MHATALLTVVTLATAAHQGPHDASPRHPSGPACDPDVVASFAAVDDALRHLHDEVQGARGRKGTRAHLQEDLDRVLANVNDARTAACRASRAEVIVVAPPAPTVNVLDRADEARLRGAMQRASFEDERIAVLALGVRDVCVTAEQAKELVREMSFSRGRVDAVRVLAPRLVDGARSYLLLDAMAFESDRRDARAILTSTAPDPQCRLPSRS